MQRQNGFTLITLLFLLALAIGVALVAFRVVPAYMDYFTVRNSLENILKTGGVDQSNESLRDSFEKRLDVNFVKNVTARDLEIDKDGGMLTLRVPINRKEHLVGGVSLSIDLEATASAPLQ